MSCLVHIIFLVLILWVDGWGPIRFAVTCTHPHATLLDVPPILLIVLMLLSLDDILLPCLILYPAA